MNVDLYMLKHVFLLSNMPAICAFVEITMKIREGSHKNIKDEKNYLLLSDRDPISHG